VPEAALLVVNRFVVATDEPAVTEFTARAGAAIEALAARPGYRAGRLGRAVDDPTRWCLVTEWESVGAYRRALGAFDVKVNASPLLAGSVDEPSGFEVLVQAGPGGPVETLASDLAAEAPW
jgi:heme oxygenase (mycobilin-producing)